VAAGDRIDKKRTAGEKKSEGSGMGESTGWGKNRRNAFLFILYLTKEGRKRGGNFEEGKGG